MTGIVIRVADDPAAAAAETMVRRLRRALGRADRATLAVSGGSTALPLFRALATADLDWDRVDVWQVDERVAPHGHPDRNANHLAVLPGRHRPMPVTARTCAGPPAATPRRCRTASMSSTSAWGPTGTPRRGRPATR